MNIEQFKESIPLFVEQSIDICKKILEGKTVLTTSFESIDGPD